MDLRLQVGLNVRTIRMEKGWSQEELAFRSELHRTYLSGVERGVRNPTVLVLERLADTLGVPAADLLRAAPSRAADGQRRR
jgi:transcriptional regulator with XRE-family HTH domain